MCFLLCVSSPVHVSVRVFISLSCVFFSLSNVSTLSTLSIVSTVHCVPLFRYSLHCFVFSLSCVCCVCVMCSGVQDVVLLLYVCMCSV